MSHDLKPAGDSLGEDSYTGSVFEVQPLPPFDIGENRSSSCGRNDSSMERALMGFPITPSGKIALAFSVEMDNNATS